MKPGAIIIGASAALSGVVGLRWGDFAAVWQPVPAETPGRTLLAYAAAVLFLIGGVALQARRTVAVGAAILAALFTLFALLWTPRVAALPLVFATWSGVAEQLACALGVMAVYVAAKAESPTNQRLGDAARFGFGLCAVAFGFNHFFNVQETAAMTPRWLPPGPTGWAIATGVFHVMGGLALVFGVQTVLAARLLGAMFAGFGLLVWGPLLWANIRDHTTWCGEVVTLSLVGAAWAIADLQVARGVRSLNGRIGGATKPRPL